MQSFNRPTVEQIDAAVLRLTSIQFERYFFERLENPLWIKPLREKGLFSQPPTAQMVSDDVCYLNWPASKYLARMAKHAPDQVSEIFASIQTDNAAIAVDMITAGLAMPAEHSARLVAALCKIIKLGPHCIDIADASKLCLYLANKGESAIAFQLAQCLFTPYLNVSGPNITNGGRYWFSHGAITVVPELAKHHPSGIVQWLCNHLNAAIAAKEHIRRGSSDDYSFMWRPAIEASGDDNTHELAGIIAGLFRLALETIVQLGALPFGEVMTFLDSQSYIIFERIKIHLINRNADLDPMLARSTMLNRTLFDDYRLKHEYAMLLEKRYPLLHSLEKEQWLSWISAGPDLSGFEESFRNGTGREPIEKDRLERFEYWQFEHLYWIRHYLDGSWRTFYDRMYETHGEPMFADRNISYRHRWGHTTPITLEEITDKPFADVIEKVVAWHPDPKQQVFGPDRNGLASTFGQFVAKHVKDVSTQAALLIGRPPIFVRTFIEQITTAIEQGLLIDIRPTLKLCEWIVDQPIADLGSSQRRPDWMETENWSWTRETISHLTKSVCNAKKDNDYLFHPKELRGALWHLLSSLTRDPFESHILEKDAVPDFRQRDFLTSAINSPRGKAVEAALLYARWVGQQIDGVDPNTVFLSGGFASLPEVKEMLEWQINPENQSCESNAILGAYFHIIYWIDKQWLATNVDQIFPTTSNEPNDNDICKWAAWNTFIVWIQPHIEYFTLLRKQFAIAVDVLPNVPISESHHYHAAHKLGEHLMVLFGRGQIECQSDHDLLRRLLTIAPPEVMFQAIQFVGWGLEGDKAISETTISRFQELWEWFWPSIGHGLSLTLAARKGFGSWFACGKFPLDWSLSQLESYVSRVGVPQPDNEVMEQLVLAAEVDIVKVLNILSDLLHAAKEGWQIYGWREATKSILKKGLSAKGDDRQVAMRIIDYLGRKGHTDFGGLLN